MWYNRRDMEVVLILHNIRSTYNVGAILRSAEGLGVKRVICSGYTPWFGKPGLLPHLKQKLQRQIQKSALGAEELIEVEWVEDIAKTLDDLRLKYKIVGLENHVAHETILSTDPKLAEKVGEKVALMLGEEVHGIPEELHPYIDLFLEIPMRGKKESFNVSVAAALAIYALNYAKGEGNAEV